MVEFILGLFIIAFIIAIMIILSPIFLVLLGIVIIILIIGSIIYFFDWIQIKLEIKHNCYDCRHYKLKDVASFGDRCWYKCDKCNIEDTHTMNDDTQIRKCKYFEYKDEVYKVE